MQTIIFTCPLFLLFLLIYIPTTPDQNSFILLSPPDSYGVQVGTSFGPVGVWLMASFWRAQLLLAVMAAGQATCLKVTGGLSAPLNQSKRQLQPALRALGKLAHSDLP